MKHLLIILLTFLLAGCATKKHIEYVDREVVRYEVQVRHDTVTLQTHDSIYHTIIQKGDTVFNTKYVERIRYRDRVVLQYDTLWRDSIRTELREVTVEKRVTPTWCWYCLILCLGFIALAVFRILRYFKVI